MSLWTIGKVRPKKPLELLFRTENKDEMLTEYARLINKGHVWRSLKVQKDGKDWRKKRLKHTAKPTFTAL